MNVPDYVTRGLASGELIDTVTAAAKLGIAPSRIHDWRRRRLVDLLRHPDGGPVTVPGRGASRDVWVWAQLDAVNTAVTGSKRGRPRLERTPPTGVVSAPGAL